MTRTYLNSAQKQSVAMLKACVMFMDQSLNSLQKFPVDIKADLKRSRTWGWKGIDKMFERLEPTTIRAINNIIRDNEIAIVSRRDVKNQMAVQEKYILGKEFIERYSEIVLEAKCKGCDGSPGSECPIRETHIHFGVEPWDPKHPVCEYIGTGAVE